MRRLVCVLLLWLAVPLQAQEAETALFSYKDYSAWLEGDKRPLVNCWNNTEFYPDGARGWGESEQLALIRDGIHILPTINTSWTSATASGAASRNPHRLEMLRFCRAHNLPLCFRSPNMPDVMRNFERWKSRPLEDSPLVWKPGRDKPSPVLSPMAEPRLWEECGREWADSEVIRQVVREYPNPPRVYWLDNNETILYTYGFWKKGILDVRLPKDLQDAEVEDFLDLKFLELYKVFHRAIREGLPSSYADVKFIGYELPYKYRLRFWNEAAQNYGFGRDFVGHSPGNFYYNHWDAIRDVEANSIQSRSHINLAGKAWLESLDPDFEWWQSVWHGSSRAHRTFPNLSTGETFATDQQKREGSQKKLSFGLMTPERYMGLVKYAIFVFQPRVVSHFAASRTRIDAPVINDKDWKHVLEAKSNGKIPMDYPRYTEREYWEACVDAVESFWRSDMSRALEGQLVEGPPEYRLRRLFWDGVRGPLAGREKWFVLKTSADPEIPEQFINRAWNYGRFYWPVHAVARETDEAVFVYAHAPLGTQQNVTITVSDTMSVVGNVPPEGRLWKLIKNGAQEVVGE